MREEHNIGFAVFGTSDGLQCKNYGIISGYDISKTIDLVSTNIRIYKGTKLNLVKREKIKNRLVTYYIKYGFAKELKTNREGTFYGSLLVLVDSKADGYKINKFLDDLNSRIELYVDSDSRFIKNINSIEIDLPEYDDLMNSIQPINDDVEHIGKDKSIISLKSDERSAVADFFNTAINVSITKIYKDVYSTSSVKILEYARGKAIVKQLDVGDIEKLKLQEENALLRAENRRLRKKNEEIIIEYRKIRERYYFLYNKNAKGIVGVSEGELKTRVVKRKKSGKYSKKRLDDYAEEIMENPIHFFSKKRIIYIIVLMLIMFFIALITYMSSSEDKEIKQLGVTDVKKNAVKCMVMNRYYLRDEIVQAGTECLDKTKQSKCIYDALI